MERSTEDGFAADRLARSGGQSGSEPFESDSAVIRGSREWLQRTIETEIVPRLMLVHRLAEPEPGVYADRADALPTAEEVEAFCSLLLADDVESQIDFVEMLRRRGVALEHVYLDLIEPAARRLGVLWELDTCDFAQVTLGLWRLQNLVFDLGSQLPKTQLERPDGPRRLMLVMAPNSQHTLGARMVADFFSRAGWEVWSDPHASPAEMREAARTDWFDLIGVSVGIESQVDSVASVIVDLKQVSSNPSVGIMVGGPLILLQPELLERLGADFSAQDAREAVAAADSFVGARGVLC